MTDALAPCPSCSRHVRASSGRCPFCGAALPDDLAARVAPAPSQRLSRAALAVFGAALAAGACNRPGRDGTDTSTIVQPYGAPPNPSRPDVPPPPPTADAAAPLQSPVELDASAPDVAAPDAGAPDAARGRRGASAPDAGETVRMIAAYGAPAPRQAP